MMSQDAFRIRFRRFAVCWAVSPCIIEEEAGTAILRHIATAV